MRLQNEPTNRKPNEGKIWFLKKREISRSFLLAVKRAIMKEPTFEE